MHIAPMSNEKSSEDFIHGLATRLSAGDAPSFAPEWVQLFEAGSNVTCDGRGPFILRDIQKVIEKSIAKSVDGKLPIDVNHALNLAAPNGGSSPAFGWMVELQARDTGLWARVEWTAAGKQLLADKAYRFLSPTFKADKKNNVEWVMSASLVNNPALHGIKPVLNSNQPKPEFDIMDFLKALLAILGLPEATEENVALAAVKSLKTDKATLLASVAEAAGIDKSADHATILLAVKKFTDPDSFVPATEVVKLSSQLDALVKATAKEKATLCIDAAIAAGKPSVKALRDHYIARHMLDAAGVETELAAMATIKLGSVVPVRGAEGVDDLSADELKTIELLGIDKTAFLATKKQIENKE
jgi:phage I-like protein